MTGVWLISYIILWILFLTLTLVVIIILRNLGIVYQSLPTGSNIRSYPTKLLAGETLPQINLSTLSGEEVSLTKFEGVKSAFSLVSATCEPCKIFLANLDENQADPLDPAVKNRVVVSISSINETLDMLQKIGLNGKHPLVLVDENKSTVEKWGVSSTPTTIIIDENLKVVRQIHGGS